MRLSQSTNFWFPTDSTKSSESQMWHIAKWSSLTSFMFKGSVSDFPGGDFIS